MARIDFAKRSLTCKLVYYGPGLAGKTTNLEHVYEHAPRRKRGELTAIATSGDRTIFFDFLPLELGKVGGLNVSFQLYTVPGQSYYAATRRLVLNGVDGIVFVADSQADRLDDALASLEELRAQLRSIQRDPAEIPLVFQWNKRDLPGVLSTKELNAALNPDGLADFPAVASQGKGVLATLRELSRLVLHRCRAEYESGSAAQAVPTRTREPSDVRAVTKTASHEEDEWEAFAGAKTTFETAESTDSTEAWDEELLPQFPKAHTIGETVGGCVIVTKLGEGGMGTAYLARLKNDPKETVVVKTLKPGREATQARVRRFFREARAAARLDHENVIRVQEVGTDERGLHYMIMQHVSGVNLKKHVQDRGRLGALEAARIILEVARALQATHAAGVIHRDVKPDNVVLAEDGDVKLIDFGLARDLHVAEPKVRPGGVVGTIMYMAPERFAGIEADARSDIYSLGLTFYFLLTGKLPFHGRKANEVMAGLARLRPPTQYAPDLPVRAQLVLEHMLARDPRARPQTAAELIAQLEALWMREQDPSPPRRPDSFWLWEESGEIAVDDMPLRWAASSGPMDVLVQERQEPPPQAGATKGYSRQVLAALDAWDSVPEEDHASSDQIARLLDDAWGSQEKTWGGHVMLDDESGEGPAPSSEEEGSLLDRGWRKDLRQALEDIDAQEVADHNRTRLSRDPGQAVVNALLQRGPARGGTRKIKRDQIRQAIRKLSRSVKKNSDHPQPWTKRGIARARAGDLEGALTDYGKALALDPGYLPALANRASANFHLRRYAEAEADASRALKRAPRLAKGWLFRGISRAVQRKPGARKDMLTFLQLSPYSPYVRYIKRLLEEVEEG